MNTQQNMLAACNYLVCMYGSVTITKVATVPEDAILASKTVSTQPQLVAYLQSFKCNDLVILYESEQCDLLHTLFTIPLNLILQ